MSAEQTSWAKVLEEHKSCAGPTPLKDVNHQIAGEEYVKRLREYSVFAQKRRALPQGAPPTEILAMILAPNYSSEQK